MGEKQKGVSLGWSVSKLTISGTSPMDPDKLEFQVDRSRWQLPTYSEMLFEH